MSGRAQDASSEAAPRHRGRGLGRALPGIALEALALWLLLTAEDPAGTLALFLALHGVACLLSALAARARLPRELGGSPLKALALLAALPLFIPGLGMLGVQLVLVPALQRAGIEEEKPWRATDFPDLPAAPFRVSAQPIYIAVGLAGVLRHVSDPDLRLKAVMASKQMPDRVAIPLLDIALKDKVDDVRLLAYSMLDGKERVIFDRIKALMQELKELPHELLDERALLHLRLAQEYWELAYLGLAQGKVLMHVLGQSEEHLGVALAARPGDAGAHLLKGRIHLKRAEVAPAREAFTRAAEAGMPPDVVAPFLAEVAFCERDFDAVRTHLGKLSASAAAKSPMAEVVRWWSEQ